MSLCLMNLFVSPKLSKIFQGHLSHGYQTPTKKYDNYLVKNG